MRSQLAMLLSCVCTIGLFDSAASAQRTMQGKQDHKSRSDLSGAEIHVSDVTGVAMFITALDGGPIPTRHAHATAHAVPIAFLIQYGHLFGINDSAEELMITGTRTDRLGHRRTTYEQRFHGTPVFGAVLHVHQNINGGVHAANGAFFPIANDVSTEPKLDRSAAVSLA